MKVKLSVRCSDRSALPVTVTADAAATEAQDPATDPAAAGATPAAPPVTAATDEPAQILGIVYSPF